MTVPVPTLFNPAVPVIAPVTTISPAPANVSKDAPDVMPPESVIVPDAAAMVDAPAKVITPA